MYCKITLTLETNQSFLVVEVACDLIPQEAIETLEQCRIDGESVAYTLPCISGGTFGFSGGDLICYEVEPIQVLGELDFTGSRHVFRVPWAEAAARIMLGKEDDQRRDEDGRPEEDA